MNICNNIIKDEEIIGMGPLLWHQKGNGPTYCHYTFQVFTKQTAIEIKSQVAEAFSYVDEEDKKMLSDFQKEYWFIRKKVAALLGEQEPDHQPHAQKMSEMFHNILTDVSELATRIDSMKTPKKSVLMQSVHAVNDNILQLKTLATA